MLKMSFSKKIFFLNILILSLLTSVSCKKKDNDADNVLNVYSREVVSSIDPMLVTDTYSVTVVRQVYEGLYEYDYLKVPYEISPVLADGMPLIKNNGLTYVINLKKGIKFVDDPCFVSTAGKGREFTAKDFIYSIKRYISSPYTSSFTFSRMMTEIIVGLEEFKNKAIKNGSMSLEEKIEGLEAIDDYTLVFKLKKTSIYFPSILTRPWAFVVAKEAVDYYGSEFAYHPVGTGPFKLTEWEQGAKLVLEKNKNYKQVVYPMTGNDAGKQLPFVDNVIMHILVEEQPRWLNFVRGNIDIVTPDKDNYYDAFPAGEELSADLVNKGVKIVSQLKLEYMYNAFNMSDAVVGKNKYLRQAISLSYDGEKHNALFFNNQAVVANWIIPPGISFGYDSKFKNKYRQYNIEEAKQLLQKAGYPNGQGLPLLTMLVPDSIAARQVGEFFVKSASEIGVRIKLESKNFGELLKQINEGKGFQLFTLAWRADFPFAEDFLRQLYSKAFSPGPNHSLFSNAEYDSLFEKALEMKEGMAKLTVLNRMRDIGVEECVIIPVIYPKVIFLTQSYIENYKPHMLMGDNYKFVRVDINKRKEIQKLLNVGR